MTPAPETATLLGVVALLEACGVPYMVVGSMASSQHGQPRSTNDADIVIDPEPAALERLVTALSAAKLYVSAEHARDALVRRRMFNAIDPATGFKVDLIVRKARAFNQEEFGRRQALVLQGRTVTFASPEDTLLAKLEWARQAGGSEKQLRDAAGIVATQGSRLDRPYVERWAQELGVLEQWHAVLGASA